MHSHLQVYTVNECRPGSCDAAGYLYVIWIYFSYQRSCVSEVMGHCSGQKGILCKSFSFSFIFFIYSMELEKALKGASTVAILFFVIDQLFAL